MSHIGRRSRATLVLEPLDDRIVPATQRFTGVGANAATSLAAFEAAIGGANNAAGPATTTGFRTINWDGVGLGATDGAFTNQVITPNHTVGIPLNRFQSRGTVFEDIYAVTDTSFTTENAGLQPPVQFPPFSGNKIFAMFNDNGIELHFVVPATNTPGGVRGFGAIFLDVETANTSSIEYFSGSSLLETDFVPTGTSGQAEFLGVLFDNPQVTNVALTLGTGTLFSFDGTNVTSGPPDLTESGTVDQVATDDFAYSEPLPLAQLDRGAKAVVSGQTNGTAVAFAADPAFTGQFATTPTSIASVFGNPAVNVRTAVGDVNGDGVPDTILVTGPGTPIRAAVVSGTDNTTVLVQPFDPFGGNFTGGGFAAASDIDRDGRSEFIVTPDQGGGPRVTIFTLPAAATTATVKANFFGIDDPAFRGGARAALGDVNADGTPDLAVSAGFLGGPRTALFNGTTLFATPTRLVGDFFAFPGTDATTLRNGVFLAVGDVNGDGFDDLIFGGGPGGAPRVFILSGALVTANDVAGAQAAPIANFYVANNSSDRGGVRLAVVNADSDLKADVLAGSGEGSPAKVRSYLGKNFTTTGEPGTFQDITVFGGGVLPGGVFVG